MKRFKLLAVLLITSCFIGKVKGQDATEFVTKKITFCAKSAIYPYEWSAWEPWRETKSERVIVDKIHDKISIGSNLDFQFWGLNFLKSDVSEHGGKIFPIGCTSRLGDCVVVLIFDPGITKLYIVYDNVQIGYIIDVLL